MFFLIFLKECPYPISKDLTDGVNREGSNKGARP